MQVESRVGYRIWLRYADGASGEVDLSDMAGKGVFRSWRDPGFFAGVHVAPHGAVARSDEIELCADAFYLELTGQPLRAAAFRAAGRSCCPCLSRFYGVVVRMYFREHGPPHFHADYAGQEAVIGIDDLAVLRGRLPPRALGFVIEWTALHQTDLRAAWERTLRREDPGKIAPLE